jgi:UDP-N-acetylmuramyl pentapeptide synthase
MAELGQFAIQEHQALAPFVQQNRVDLAFLYGPYMRYLQEQLPPSINSQHFESIPALMTSLLSQLQPGDCILVKGGHGQRAYDGIMQQVVVALQHLAHEPCQKVRG